VRDGRERKRSDEYIMSSCSHTKAWRLTQGKDNSLPI
jgi:hypothetical protein